MSRIEKTLTNLEKMAEACQKNEDYNLALKFYQILLDALLKIRKESPLNLAHKSTDELKSIIQQIETYEKNAPDR